MGAVENLEVKKSSNFELRFEKKESSFQLSILTSPSFSALINPQTLLKILQTQLKNHLPGKQFKVQQTYRSAEIGKIKLCQLCGKDSNLHQKQCKGGGWFMQQIITYVITPIVEVAPAIGEIVDNHPVAVGLIAVLCYVWVLRHNILDAILYGYQEMLRLARIAYHQMMLVQLQVQQWF